MPGSLVASGPLNTGQLASNRSFPGHPPVGGGPWTSHSGGCGSARSTPSKAPPRECHPGPQSTIGLSVEGPAPRPTGPAHGPKETSQLAGTESPHIRRIPPSKGQMGLSSPPLDRSPAGQDSSQLACVCPRHIVYRRASPFHVASMPSLAIPRRPRGPGLQPTGLRLPPQVVGRRTCQPAISPHPPWPSNQLANILDAQIRARGPSSGFPPPSARRCRIN